MVIATGNRVVFGNGKKKAVKGTAAKWGDDLKWFEPFGYETLNYANVKGIVSKYDYAELYKLVGVDTQNSTQAIMVLFTIKFREQYKAFAVDLQSGVVPLSDVRLAAGRDTEMGPTGTVAKQIALDYAAKVEAGELGEVEQIERVLLALTNAQVEYDTTEIRNRLVAAQAAA